MQLYETGSSPVSVFGFWCDQFPEELMPRFSFLGVWKLTFFYELILTFEVPPTSGVYIDLSLMSLNNVNLITPETGHESVEGKPPCVEGWEFDPYSGQANDLKT